MNLNIFKYTVARVLIDVKNMPHLVTESLLKMGPKSFC